MVKESDFSQYLANVIYVAKPDGVLSSSEEQAIEKIRIALGAGSREYQRARSLLTKSDFALTPTGCFSEKVRNVEDMVYLALADGELADSETRVIIEFAKQVNINQKQIDEIVAEAKLRARETEATVPCPSCDNPMLVSASFCPQCGLYRRTDVA
jgi:tellurite resistance protein